MKVCRYIGNDRRLRIGIVPDILQQLIELHVRDVFAAGAAVIRCAYVVAAAYHVADIHHEVDCLNDVPRLGLDIPRIGWVIGPPAVDYLIVTEFVGLSLTAPVIADIRIVIHIQPDISTGLTLDTQGDYQEGVIPSHLRPPLYVRCKIPILAIHTKPTIKVGRSAVICSLPLCVSGAGGAAVRQIAVACGPAVIHQRCGQGVPPGDAVDRRDVIFSIPLDAVRNASVNKLQHDFFNPPCRSSNKSVHGVHAIAASVFKHIQISGRLYLLDDLDVGNLAVRQ